MSHEFEWIKRYFAPLAGAGAGNLQNDAALLSIPEGQQLVITTDTLNEGVHFKAGTTPEKIAQKALRVNLSDLAAMGATPLGYTLNLSLPASLNSENETWLASFCEGLKQDQQCFGLSLLGGDTTRIDGRLSITITAFGHTPDPLLRSGAKAGDCIYVTGQIGAGFLGLHNHSPETIRHYECPSPRVETGVALRGFARACIDISDGLVQDLGHLCAASGVGAEVDLARIPLADPSFDIIKQITGGDDYELLFTAPADVVLPEDMTYIGDTIEDNSIQWLNENGEAVKIEKGGWQHF